MVAQERLYTADELLSLQTDKHRYALVAGRLIAMSPTVKSQGKLMSAINAMLFNFVLQHDLGEVYGAETGFKFAGNPDTVLGVDSAFVAKSRGQSGEGFFQGGHDLAVEVISPGNSEPEIHNKVKA